MSSTADHRHTDPDCDGGFRPVHGPSNALDGGPQGLVCPECGAWRPINDLGGAD